MSRRESRLTHVEQHRIHQSRLCSGLMFGEASAVFEKANNRTFTQHFFCPYKNKKNKNKHILSEVTFFLKYHGLFLDLLFLCFLD